MFTFYTNISSSKTDEKEKRSLGTTFDCTQKPLCDVNAACTAELRDEKRYICVCNNGFKGNGSVCRGMRVRLPGLLSIQTIQFDCVTQGQALKLVLYQNVEKQIDSGNR